MSLESEPEPEPPHLTATSPFAPPFRYGLSFGASNAFTWMIALGTPMVLLCEQLGATTFQVGLAYASVFLLLPVQVLATGLLPYLGYQRQMMLAWGLRSIFLFIPLGLALSRPDDPPPWMAMLMVASIILFSLFRAMGSALFFPWMYQLLPMGLRGRYYTTEQALTGIAGCLTMLLSAGLMALLSPWTAFALLYVLALLGSAGSVFFISRLPHVEVKQRFDLRLMAREIPRLCLRPGKFRQYMWLVLSVAAVGNAFAPFTTYYLRVHAELSDGRILVLMAVQVVGSVLGALLLRNFIDGLCARPVFKLFLILQALVFTYWLLLVHGGSGWLDWLPVAYFVVGFGAALNMQGNLKYSPQLSNDAQRALVLAIHSSVVGFLGGLAPILWGWFLKEPGPPARMNIEHFSYYLIASIVMMVVLFPFFGRLKESAPQPLPAFDSSSVLRPFRWVAVSINLVPRGNGHDEGDPKPAAETAEK